MVNILDRILTEINPQIISYKGNDLIGEGIITSLDLIGIVSEIEEELKMEIQPDDIVTENFTSYVAIKKLFFKYLQKNSKL